LPELWGLRAQPWMQIMHTGTYPAFLLLGFMFFLNFVWGLCAGNNWTSTSLYLCAA
jgi:hypothetical protein